MRTARAGPRRDALRRPKHAGLLLVLLLVAVAGVVLAAHWPVLACQAVARDDPQYVSQNPLVRQPGWESARRFLVEVLHPSTVEGYYHPLTMISLMLDAARAGRVDDLRPFHATNLGLHMANVLLLVVLVYMLFRKPLPTALAGLLFGVHPLTVEPVAWISERKTVLSTFFALWFLIIYVQYVNRRGWKLYAALVASYVLALMAKPTALPLPLLLFLLDYWPLRRRGRQMLLEKLPLLAIGALFAGITYLSQRNAAAVLMPTEFSAARIPLIICHNIVFYLLKFAWPAGLCNYYPIPQPLSLSNGMVLAGLIGTVALLAALAASLRWTRALVAGGLIFFVALFPTLGVIGFTDVIAADKYVYLPAIGLLLPLAWLLCRLMALPSRVARTATVVVTLALSIAAFCATRHCLAYWRDTETLCRRALAIAPQAAVMHMELGIELGRQNRMNEALPALAEAVRLQPEHPKAQYNLGLARALQGQIDAAVPHFAAAVRLKPSYLEARSNLARALSLRGRRDEAIAQYKEVLRLNDADPAAHRALGILLAQSGRGAEALSHLRRAVQLAPADPHLAGELAWLLAAYPDDAMRDGRAAMRIAEQSCAATGYQDPILLATLAAAYAEAGQFDRAVQTIDQARARAADAQSPIPELDRQRALYAAGRPCRQATPLVFP
jgi:Flp pilus assembly protein TadD